jgi:hypothetical protein
VQWVDHDPATWIAYVVEVRSQYQLDPAQVSTAESIHHELRERAEAFVSSRVEALTAVPAAQRSTHDAYAPVREAFQELRDRIDALPTTAQRTAAQQTGPPHSAPSDGIRPP